MAQDRIAHSIFVEGKVQGVFFREWTVQKAREIGVSGWVRNRRDGRVEIYVVGDAVLLMRFEGELKQGSPASQVENVAVYDAALEAIEGFTRRQTT
jgi:acylphosphatase